MNSKKTVYQSPFVLIPLLGLALSLASFLVLSHFQEFNLFPNENKAYDLHEYEEDFCAEKSKQLTIKKNQFIFTYSLLNTDSNPFAGVCFESKQSNHVIQNIEEYNQLNIELSASKSKRIPIYLKFLPIDKNLKVDFVPFQYVLEYHGPKKYSIKLSDFKIPSWWIREYKVETIQQDIHNYKDLTHFHIENCQAIPTGTTDIITVKSIVFSNNNLTAKIVSGIFLILSLILIVLGFRKKWTIENTIENYEPLKVVEDEIKIEINEEDEILNMKSDLQKIKEFMELNYTNPELSANDLHQELKINSRVIYYIFKNELKTTFNVYLNDLRLTEVKRLLIDSDLTIAEIAFKCGYNQIPHFNRIFKQQFQVTPKEYREKNRGNS